MDSLGLLRGAVVVKGKLRLGLIGAGPWGRNYIRTIAGLGGVGLSRVASGQAATAALVGDQCVVSADWREVAGASDLDGVIIAAPPALHADMASAAVENDLPVLVEKPLTMDLGQAMKLLELTRRRQGFVLVDHIYLFHPAYEALKERARRLGPIRAISSRGGNIGTFRTNAPVLWDWGPHDVALALDLLGARPIGVEAAQEEARQTEQGLGEILRLSLRFPGDVAAHTRIGNLMARRERSLEVRFEHQALVFDDLKPDKLAIHDLRGGALGPGRALPCSDTPPLTRAVEAFVRAIRAGARDITGLQLGVDVVEVLTRCQKSLEAY